MFNPTHVMNVLCPLFLDGGTKRCKTKEDYPDVAHECCFEGSIENQFSNPNLAPWAVKCEESFIAILEANPNYNVLSSEEIIENETI